MSVTIWHNPRCSKSRQTLDLIRAQGVEPVIVEYLRTPPGPDEIRAALDRLGIAPADLMRHGEAVRRELGLGADTDPEALIAAMAEHPILIERPVVLSPKGARIGRPPESVLEIL